MRYHVFESGSKGNCTLIYSNNHYLMIDLGISKKALKTKLAEVNLDIENIEALLYTHKHTDHVCPTSCNLIERAKVFATKSTFDVSDENSLIPFKKYQIAGFTITAIPTSHDADGSLGFIIEDGDSKMVYITDTGYIFERALPLLKNADYYIFESNHDVRMLLNTDRPQYLKRRILGDYGHLSNEDSALYLSELIGDKTKEITLAHLSQEANTDEQAILTFQKIMKDRNVSTDSIIIRCASQTDTISGGVVEMVTNCD